MASLIIIALIVAVTAFLSFTYLVICSAIRREDRIRSLRFEATSLGAQSARGLLGLRWFKWE